VANQLENPTAWSGAVRWERVKDWWARRQSRHDAVFQARLDEVRRHNPVPVFWLFGKTQSGKTSIIKFLTGADDAEIGHGFQPCTRFSRFYDFPNAEAPLLRFLDTRGVDEPGYDPADDLAKFGASAHVVIVTVKALDHAQENVVKHLAAIRASKPTRPVLLTLTCLHEAYPQQQHVQPYPFRGAPAAEPFAVPINALCLTDLVRSLEAQRQRFAELVDDRVAVDLTKPEEGYDESQYGGPALRDTLLKMLPEAQRQTLAALENGLADLRDLRARKVMPTIIGYSALAGSAGAIPVPFVSLYLLPGIQRQMIAALAEQFGRPMEAEQFADVAHKLGIGDMRTQMRREFWKVIPSIGIVAGAHAAGATTYAVGKAFCFYDAAAAAGDLPEPEKLRQYYEEQLESAKSVWGTSGNGKAGAPA
jgi:uncharacterized protein (DUF697 family)